MMSVRRKAFYSCATAILGALACSPALAQSGAATGAVTGIGEVIVTAERTEQTVQKAPLTIQVVTGAQVTSAGITDVAALSRVAAGVQIGMGGPSSQIFIRGVGAFNFDTVSTPGVAVNVDGVYVSRPEAVNGNFYDLARVEVLKGPQGTLYGRNANGGSINLITNEPKLHQTSANLSVEAGNFALTHETGAVNVPVGDKAALRAAFNVVHRDGYISSGADDDIEQSARLRFKWQPTDDVTVNLSADATHLGGQGNDFVYLPQRPGSDPYEAEGTAAANAYMHAFPGGLGFLQENVLNNSRQNSHLYNVSGQLDWRIADFATLTVLEAYRAGKIDYVTHNAGNIHISEKPWESSTEVRLGNTTPKLTWVVGGYFSDDSVPNGYTAVRVGPPLQTGFSVNTPTTYAYAGFGQATYKLTDRFRAIAGLRYTDEYHTRHGQSFTDAGVLKSSNARKQDYDGTSYKIGGEYDITPRSMVYLTYSTGFKSGGLNGTSSYDPEYLKSTEFGSRNRFFDNRLQLNFGAF
jgi:iron complex outermembrane receptor protein